MDDDGLDTYNEDRGTWHANLGPIATPQMQNVIDCVSEIVASNRQDSHTIKGAVAVDGPPSLGKTLSIHTFARMYDRRQMKRFGPTTARGNERVPVCNVSLTSSTTMKALNRMVCEFYMDHHRVNGTAAQLGTRALDFVLACETTLILIDDIHFLNPKRREGEEVVTHLKALANTLPVTFVFAGVDLEHTGLLSEGRGRGQAAQAQTGRRWTRVAITPFEIGTDAQRQVWRSTLLSIEKDLVLSRASRGMLADHLSDYLYARTTGNIGSLMTLINRGCARAVRTGEEAITRDLLDGLAIDAAAEALRPETQSAFETGVLTTQVGAVTRRPISRQAKPAGHD